MRERIYGCVPAQELRRCRRGERVRGAARFVLKGLGYLRLFYLAHFSPERPATAFARRARAWRDKDSLFFYRR
jgi:hypothetical protein